MIDDTREMHLVDKAQVDGAASEERWVYFIRMQVDSRGVHGPIKIGSSNPGIKGVQDRLSSLQSGNPCKLHVVAVIRGGGYKKERELHRRFKPHRMEGEWFAPAPDLTEYIASHTVPWQLAKDRPVIKPVVLSPDEEQARALLEHDQWAKKYPCSPSPIMGAMCEGCALPIQATGSRYCVPCGWAKRQEMRDRGYLQVVPRHTQSYGSGIDTARYPDNSFENGVKLLESG